MLASSEINQLQLRKQALVMESALNRHALMDSVHSLKQSLPMGHGGMNLGALLGSGWHRYLVYLAPIAGALLVYKWRSTKGLLSKVMSLWGLGSKAWKVFRFFNAFKL